MATIKFKQKSLLDAQKKMKRLTGNKVCGTIGFCSFTIVKDYSDYLSQEKIADDPFCINSYEENNMFAWAIEASSTYHVESTIKAMYETNGKNW